MKPDSIWTEEEAMCREINNMIDRGKKKCANCHWGGIQDSEFVVCGYHYENFSRNSFCASWTDPNDPKLKAYQERKKERLRKKLKSKKP